MSKQHRQLSFDLTTRPALGREDFFISPANALAVNLIDRTIDLPGQKLVISGSSGAGKSHLAHVWAQKFGARQIDAQDLPGLALPDLAQHAVAVEDVPRIAGQDDAERALFHLHNMLAQAGQPLLLTGRPAPNLWKLHLPDLQSRVDAAAHARLEPPDDALLSAILAKLFADRQLTPRRDVIPYIVRHMERSTKAAISIVEQLDQAALAERRDVTRTFAARVLGQGNATG